MSREVAIIETAPPSPLTDREAELIHTEEYMRLYGDQVKDLMEALGRGDKWSSDPRELQKYVLPAWLGGEHGDSASKDKFTPEQRAAAWPILSDMGLLRRIIAEPDLVVDDAVVVGGTSTANFRREGEVHFNIANNGLKTPSMRLWVGQRFREPVVRGVSRDGTLSELMDPEGRFPGHDLLDNRWVRRHIIDRPWNAEDPAQAMFPTETELGRLMMLKQIEGGADVLPTRIDLAITDLNDPNASLPSSIEYSVDGGHRRMPARVVMDHHFVDQNGMVITVMNAAAQPRDVGPPRHHTKSCTQEWLDRYPPRQGANVLYASGNPHGVRTAQDTYRILQEQGRGDVNLIVVASSLAGSDPIHVQLGTERDPSVPAEPSILLVLGEVAASIALEVKRHYNKD
jgi:hypothetical protein